MVEGRWDEFGGELPDVFRARVDASGRRRSSSASRASGSSRCATAASSTFALGSVLGVERPLWFEPGYTSMSRMLASRGGIKSVASLNELAHLTATRDARTTVTQRARRSA